MAESKLETAVVESNKRVDTRYPAAAVPAITAMRLSPGDGVTLVNISASGVLVEGKTRFVPGTRVNAFGHLGDGNIHFNVMAPDGAGPDWLQAQPPITAFVHDLVTAAGGSISAEHGIGQMKLAEFARLGGATRLDAMRAIKRALDPQGIMNPGKLVPPFDDAQDRLA